MLIKNENMPNVIIITGKERILRIGFKTIFAAASTAPAIIKAGNWPVNSTPFTNQADIKIASELANVQSMNAI